MERWELMDRSAFEAHWLMPGWVNKTLDDLGREDVVALIPSIPRPP